MCWIWVGQDALATGGARCAVDRMGTVCWLHFQEAVSGAGPDSHRLFRKSNSVTHTIYTHK